jgi:hypothetical protein
LLGRTAQRYNPSSRQLSSNSEQTPRYLPRPARSTPGSTLRCKSLHPSRGHFGVRNYRHVVQTREVARNAIADEYNGDRKILNAIRAYAFVVYEVLVA